ncbi:hypothetical protein P4637_17105 [Halalkalibacterium halodurans]|uniref:BH0985 protein n=1 Tax=Halalkalibacterium halodurans (strain ATCC BAA-125 / DSM 18197 / FERM 7344 / JCM 9153 / C-125) TaxID=272558 RepID=Q9KE72_HALH5|nr:hypothetical protein [Halalkalibacterium halodurans]MDY7221523.1 hypothetical protein [Halalkalibacterium halodurans]MDY7240799.1 hypothetical protein [Halalkalibacterium halodurans]MED4080454.1 hypothetical protein [Halalkalibacterium halodurans]MED4086533.1 hypothetical protein [Halalkalibacterium halodurans]MED4104758.1 hypothetical protein [Halalkalibacterium halodurans]
MTVISSELDLFWEWTRFQESHPDFLRKYNRLKEQFHGKQMEMYRREKNRFFETVLTSEAYQSFVQQIDRTKGGSDGE